MASQGAGRNSGQAAGSGRFVKFSHGAAQRIAKAVRVVEGGNRDQPGIVFDHPMPGGGKMFRVCTYTGSWSIGSSKTVTFKYQTSTPNTASATNLFFPVTNTASSSRDCAIAKDGTAWFLVDVAMTTASAVFVTGTATGISVSSTQSTSVLTDVTLSASLNTSACTISIGKTLVTASQIFVTGTATAVFVTGTASATYLRLE